MKKAVVVLMHLVYWLLYLLLLGIFYLLMGMDHPRPPLGNYWWIMIFFAGLPGAGGFYVFYTVLFERFLARRRLWALLLAAVAASLLVAACSELLMYVVLKDRVRWNIETAISFCIITGIVVLLNGAMGLGMRSFITWYRELRWKEALNQKNHEMEMALVRAQLNPHFLFNTINNIDILISKDAGRASDYLNRLSDILRFTLYETRTDKIPLEKEIRYIEKYIALQQIRSSNPEFIQYKLSGDPAGYHIAPVLMIPFLENAFKHLAPRKAGPSVCVQIDITAGRLLFYCSNTFVTGAGVPDEYGGLGHELIHKRLELLYPGNYELHIATEEQLYSVTLTILLS